MCLLIQWLIGPKVPYNLSIWATPLPLSTQNSLNCVAQKGPYNFRITLEYPPSPCPLPPLCKKPKVMLPFWGSSQYSKKGLFVPDYMFSSCNYCIQLLAKLNFQFFLSYGNYRVSWKLIIIYSWQMSYTQVHLLAIMPSLSSNNIFSKI